MVQRFRYFVVVLLLMFAKQNFAQIYSNKVSLISFRQYTPEYKKRTAIIKNSYVGNSIFYYKLISPIEKSFYVQQLGVFCKNEFELEKKTSIPLRLRLGSLDYTNYLEQKPNAVRPVY